MTVTLEKYELPKRVEERLGGRERETKTKANKKLTIMKDPSLSRTTETAVAHPFER